MGKCVLFLLLMAVALPAMAGAIEFRFKEEFLERLVQLVPGIMKTQNPETGRFGEGIWIVGDQNVIYPLAAAWSIKSEKNPYYHDSELLEAIMDGGDALISDADKNGMWEFRKKDGSTWGKIYMPWTYGRWVRAYALIRDGMPPERRKKWEDALILGYGGISKTALTRVQNIPAYHAMGLYAAGQVFNRPEWCEQAKEFLVKVAAEQDPVGFWTEHYGPVVAYNVVYVDALGIYYGMSRDKTVLPALERAARFHASFTYPDGSKVETVDERNPYHGGIFLGDIGFCFSPEGRGFLMRQLEKGKASGHHFSADSLADFLLYGEEGPAVPTAADSGNNTLITNDGKAMISRKGKWFTCLSAYCCPVSNSRWIQDRQNLISIFHDHTGLIIGGGNTKLQPLWSTFSVGDISLLRHTPGNENPNFIPPHGITHVPSAAKLPDSDRTRLELEYGQEKCSVEVEPIDDRRLRIRLHSPFISGLPVEAHLPILVDAGKSLNTASGQEYLLDGRKLALSDKETGSWISQQRWRVSVPEGTRIIWPAMPHNPYAKDGEAKANSGRLVLALPFSEDKTEYEVVVSVE